MLAATLITFSGLVSLSTAGYVLKDDYNTQNFFSMFDFFTADDPTHGYVNYVSQSAASSSNLINTNNGVVYMGVDSTSAATGRGRNSVRITSKASYNEGLVILDLAHMPGNACGSWPAFWMVGGNWPAGGEIDIIEGVNSQSGNAMTLHTNAGCSINNSGFTGQLQTSNCDVNAAGQAANTGCGIKTNQASSYGDGFNAAQGGVYATEWTSEAISVWYFPRSAIPADIASGWPNPSGWGAPTAHFSGSCDISQHFTNQQIVFDTTFCGDWAGNVWSTDVTCSAKASTCQSFVQNNPSAFKESYWSINSLKVYSSGGPGIVGSVPHSVSVPVPTASQGVPVSASLPVSASWPISTGISSAQPVVPPTQPSAVTHHSWSWGHGGGKTQTYSAVSQGQFYQETASVAAASVPAQTPSAASSEASPTPPAAPTADSTPSDTAMNVAVDPNGVVGEMHASAPSPPSPTATTTTVSPGAASGKVANKKIATVSTLTYDDFPKEKREDALGAEEEQKIKRHVHRHIREHKRQWGMRGAWRA